MLNNKPSVKRRDNAGIGARRFVVVMDDEAVPAAMVAACRAPGVPYYDANLFSTMERAEEAARVWNEGGKYVSEE